MPNDKKTAPANAAGAKKTTEPQKNPVPEKESVKRTVKRGVGDRDKATLALIDDLDASMDKGVSDDKIAGIANLLLGAIGTYLRETDVAAVKPIISKLKKVYNKDQFKMTRAFCNSGYNGYDYNNLLILIHGGGKNEISKLPEEFKRLA